MKLIKTNSSTIVGTCFDPATSTLYVGFKSGVYSYSDFTQEQYTALIEAPSIGSHFATDIRKQWADKTLKLAPEDVDALFGEEPYIDLTIGTVTGVSA
jgi:hypothetical protein